MKEEVQENLHHIENKAKKEIITWCFRYYDRYKKAPYLNIQDIFEEERDFLEPAQEDLIGAFLKNLSRKYQEMDDYGAEFEVGSARKALRSVRMRSALKGAGRLVEEGLCDEACELFLNEGLASRPEKDLSELTLSLTEFITTKLDMPKMLVKPWLTASSINMIYGRRGIGKSWLTHVLAVSLTRRETSIDIGPWRTRRGASVFLVDGEMSKAEVQYRLKKLVAYYGMGEGHSLYLLAESLNLTKERHRRAILEIAHQKQADVILLDNISALFPGLDENDKRQWDPINQWLLSLKSLGFATVLIHHAGKGGDQRGTSGREDSLDTVIKLRAPPGYSPDQGARFTIRFEKARNVRPNTDVGSFEFSVTDLLNTIL